MNYFQKNVTFFKHAIPIVAFAILMVPATFTNSTVWSSIIVAVGIATAIYLYLKVETWILKK